MRQKLLSIPLADVDEPAAALRAKIDPDRIRELADSIQKIGQIVPILVFKKGARWEIVSGHRRYLALRLLRLDTVKAIEHDGHQRDRMLAQVAENCARVDLTPTEEADAVHHLVVEEGLDLDVVAKSFGKGRSWAEKRLEIHEWPEDIRKAIAAGDLTLGAATELAAIKDAGYRDYYLTSAISGGCTAATARIWRSEWEARGNPTMAAPAEHTAPQDYHAPPAVGLECSNCGTLTRINDLRTLHICPRCLTPKEG